MCRDVRAKNADHVTASKSKYLVASRQEHGMEALCGGYAIAFPPRLAPLELAAFSSVLGEYNCKMRVTPMSRGKNSCLAITSPFANKSGVEFYCTNFEREPHHIFKEIWKGYLISLRMPLLTCAIIVCKASINKGMNTM